MRLQLHGSDAFTAWFSVADTTEWARRWPCSAFRGRRVRVSFDSNGLYDYTVNGRCPDVDAHELSALVCSLVGPRLDPEHPAYFVAVGQFGGES